MKSVRHSESAFGTTSGEKKLFYIPAPILLSGLLFFSSSLFAQNLVPNPSFEQYDTCPNNYGGNNLGKNWKPFRPSPDYFNTCAPSASCVSIPGNCFGFQLPDSGNGYIGMGCYNLANDNELIGCQLTSQLILGTRYYVSLKVSLSDFSPCAINNIGVLFSTKKYCWHLNEFNNCDSFSLMPHFNNAHVYSSKIIVDTSQWVIVSGSFVADSSYEYIVVGNMFDDTLTNDSLLYGNTSCNSTPVYYYIDDICVSTDSMTCETAVGVNEIDLNNAINVFPNPCSDFLEILFLSPHIFNNAEIHLYDYLGRAIFSEKINAALKLDVKNFVNGFYIFRINTNQESFSKKIIINH